MAGIVTIGEQLSQLPEGTVNSVTSIPANTANKRAVVAIELAMGDNSIAVPSWAAGCIIRPDPLNTVALTINTAAGSAGPHISQIYPSELTFDPANVPAALHLGAASAQSTFTEIEFF